MTSKLTALIEAAKAATPWRAASRKEFEKQNPVPAYYRFHAGQYIQAYPISEEQWWESVKYHNDFLLWNQAWEACLANTLANPATILELCALLEKAEKALNQSVIVRERLMRWRRNAWPSTDQETIVSGEYPLMDKALAAIKQWKEKT